MLLFTASTNLGYYIFTYVNKKITNVFVRTFTNSDATGLHLGKSSNRLENYYAKQARFSALR